MPGSDTRFPIAKLNFGKAKNLFIFLYVFYCMSKVQRVMFLNLPTPIFKPVGLSVPSALPPAS